MKKIFAMMLCICMLLLPVVSAAETANALYGYWKTEGDTLLCTGAPMGLEVSVTAGGQSVPGCTVTTVEDAGIPITYFCLVDQSRSFGQMQKDQQKQALLHISSQMRPIDSMVLITMGTELTVGDPLTTPDARSAAIDSACVHEAWSTCLYQALIRVTEEMADSEKYDGIRCAVVFSDGIDDGATSVTEKQASQALTESRFPVYYYGVLMLFPDAYARNNAQRIETLAALTPGGMSTVPSRDDSQSNSRTEDAAGKILESILGSAVIRVPAAELNRSGEKLGLQVTGKTGRTGTLQIPVSALPALPAPTEPPTTVPETLPETEPMTESAPEPTAPAPQPTEPEKSGSLLPYLLIGGGVAAVIITVLLVVIGSRRRSPAPIRESDADDPDENMPPLRREDEEDVVLSDDLDFSSLLAQIDDDELPAAPRYEPGDDQFSLSDEVLSFGDADAPAKPRVSGWEVELIPENGEAVGFFLAGSCGKILGRNWKSEVILDSVDNRLSGAHFEICCDNSGLYLRDCGSSNGTAVDGEGIAPGTWVALSLGSVITAGSHSYRLEARKID